MTQIEIYKGFTIENLSKQSTSNFVFLRAKRIVEDKLDKVLIASPKYHLWTSNTADPEIWNETELLQILKKEIDQYHTDKLEILDDIITRISKGEQL